MTPSPPTVPFKGAIGYIKDNPLVSVGLALALVYAVFGIIAGIRAHSPVPFWDMWDGSLGFYMNQQTDPSAWWAQHNEHRIILARILFFLDLQYFGGQAVFLLVTNYVLAAATFTLLAWCGLRIAVPATTSMRIIAAVILTLTYLWTQENNLTWGFQSQFFLAQLMPLASLVLLWRSGIPGRHRSWWFAASLCVAVLAAGSMANGVVASWLVLAGCLIGRQSWKRCAVALLVAIAVGGFYFHGYVSPGGNSLATILKGQPRGVVWFLFSYLGSPFAHLVPEAAPNVPLAAACGGVITVLAAFLGSTALLRRRVSVDLELVIGLFLAYLGASAAAVSTSRVIFGLESAVASRYTTPALLVIGCILILGGARLSGRFAWARGRWASVLLFFPLAFLPLQLSAIKHNQLADFEKVTAALALEMGARDDEQIMWTYPDSPRVLEIAHKAAAQDLSIFANPWIRDASNSIGKIYRDAPAAGCGVVPPVTTDLPHSEKWSRLQGGLVDERLGNSLSTLYLLDAQDRIIGRGVLAVPERAPGNKDFGAPFKLYAPRSALTPGPMKVVIPGICSGAFNYQ
ncbi:hypothetical protein [Stenotrophomonas rhizophila]|uniref:hypothetical protein n=1 Tax=Stenotrophomonas rhizophila TaxID=216778 RepID=UPI001E5D7473|nr:hypothetical protein [Stenotrophomonas rhizophila]MCC7634087.1 hypothetical protein [Stenotrophomonas rhizophila]MCC7662783.1 hypothetical protein [Stenotrophomonas rhizophila]